MKNYSLSHNGFIYTLNKEPSESNDIFMTRLWYISKKEPHNQLEFDKYKNLSLIWRNSVFYKLNYDTSITNLL